MDGRRLLLLLFTASLASFCACAGSQPDSYYSGSDASADVGFYSQISRYGTWVDVAPYGRCWVPLDVSVGWRPYTQGYWVDTDYGWMWISQDPWGAIPYHYGRWALDDSYGWLWVPDDDEVWAPAWVSWRYGDGYVGWAPLPPDVGWQTGSGLTVSAAVLDQRITRDSWCFVPTRSFGTTRIRASVLPPSRNVTFISRTQNVTQYGVVNSRPAERGLDLVLEHDTGRTFQRYQVLDSSSPASLRGDKILGRTIEAYRPSVSGSKNPPVRPTTQEQSAPTRAVIQRLDTQERRFDQRMRRERAELDREQQRELKRQSQDRASTEEIRQRHQAEMQAQQEREGKERRALDRRRRIVQDMGSNKGQGKEQNQGKGHDKQRRERGKSKDKGQAEGEGSRNPG